MRKTLLTAAALSCLTASCSGSNRTQQATNSSTDKEPPPIPAEPVPARISIDREFQDTDEWLMVERHKEGVEGAWATATFDAQRNKLTIDTNEVQQFAIDVSKVPIKWDTLVIISIDGRNSELRHHKSNVIRFSRDEHGLWRVIEP